MPDKIDDFYNMCEIFDDDMDMVILAIKELSGAKEKPSILRMWVESLNVKRLSGYIDHIMSIELHRIKTWKISRLHRQTTIHDFIGG